MVCSSVDEQDPGDLTPLCLQAVTLGRRGEVLSHVAYALLAM